MMTRREELIERYHLRQFAACALHGDKPYRRAKRYMEHAIFAPVYWQPPRDDRPSSRKMAYVEKSSGMLRLVGRVEAESYGSRSKTWCTRDTCGWYTDPDGYVMTDGDGLCWGVVYQLSTRKGKLRFVAGYQFGGTDDGPTLDLGRIYESRNDGETTSPPVGADGALEAARRADDMARDAAEEERWYREEQREEDEEDEDDDDEAAA